MLRIRRGALLALLLSLLLPAGCDLTEDASLGVKSSGDGDGGGGDGDPPPDDDDDGLSNEVEKTFEMNTRVADSDSDGFGDGLEFVGDNGDPLDRLSTPRPLSRAKTLPPDEVSRSEADADQDGLGNRFEEQNSLESDNPDTDEDGYTDGLELVANSNPFESGDRPTRDAPPAPDGSTPGTPPVDADRDGLSDDVENELGTSASTADSDGDGFSDGLERLIGSDGNNPASVPNFSVPTPPTTTTSTVTTTTTLADESAADEEDEAS